MTEEIQGLYQTAETTQLPAQIRLPKVDKQGSIQTGEKKTIKKKSPRRIISPKPPVKFTPVDLKVTNVIVNRNNRPIESKRQSVNVYE